MSSEVVAGFTHMDEKGRVSLSRAARSGMRLHAGSTVAWVKVGDAVMLIPQDAYLEQVMEAAAQTLEGARIPVKDMLDDLPEARAAVVAERYGEEFLDTLGRLRDEQRAQTS
jgi:hypothetical protein